MPRCGPWVAVEKARVYRQDEGDWRCSQTLRCQKCGDLDWPDATECDTWAEAMANVVPPAAHPPRPRARPRAGRGRW